MLVTEPKKNCSSGHSHSGLPNKLPPDFVPAAEKLIDGWVKRFIQKINLIRKKAKPTVNRAVGFRGKNRHG
jgi:hypothetical protein